MTTQRFVRPLLAWYKRNGRALPWRKTADPYKIWISEVMLQQTQVSRVEGYYSRFLQRFPTVEKLAAARWQSVLPYWRGLGYYGRGRNLLQAAKTIVRVHDRKLPQSFPELRTLPGIGEYTASAILSFAFGQAVPALDTNLKRVLARVLGKTGAEVTVDAEKIFRSARKNAPHLNHALMDIGALLCKSRHVACEECPLRPYCVFFKSGAALTLNVSSSAPKTPRASRGAIDVGAACIHRDGRYLIARRSPAKGGEWEFPGGKREPGESIRDCLKREIREELGVEIAVRPAFFVSSLERGGKRYRIHFCRSQILRGKPKNREHAKLAWVERSALLDFDLAGSNRDAAKILGGKD
ncbi:MAG: NUDIX domain-containing protein [Bdellovibrionota bacterium]